MCFGVEVREALQLPVPAASSRRRPASETSTCQTTGLQGGNHVGGLIQIAVPKDSFSDYSVRRVK